MTGSRKFSEANRERRQPTWTERRAAVAKLRRLAAGGRPLGCHVEAVAKQHGVTPRAVYRWLKDDRLTEEKRRPARSGRFDVTVEHLTVLAQEQTVKGAYDALLAVGLVECSYATFHRAVKERANPTLVAAALDGHKGMVNNRMYLSWTPPHRNHTWHLDHTVADVWVWPSHKHRTPVRPQLTGVVDGATGLSMVIPWVDPVNAEMVAAALTEFAVMRDYHGIQVGGTPEQVVLDNAAQHFAHSVTEGVERLGWILTPTDTYSSWQNGKAESLMRLVNQRLADRLPGATKAGTARNGSPRFSAALKEKIVPSDVLAWEAFVSLLQDCVDEINTTIRVRRLGRRTRLEAYATDPTEQRAIDRDVMRTAMMRTSLSHTASKNGIRFCNRDYVGRDLEYGRKYEVRYLPLNPDFIEVFTATGDYVGPAYWVEKLTKQQISLFMGERARQEREIAAIDAGVRAHRRHLAASENANALYGHETTQWTGADERTAAVTPPTEQGHAPVLEAVEDTESLPRAEVDAALAEEDGLNTKRKPPRRRSGQRPKLPRTPTGDSEPPPKDLAVDRLAERFGHVLPPLPDDN